MKEIFYEKRLYPGYPVFEIVYYDIDNQRYSYTTASSMYNLGKMIVLGLNDNNAYKCILESKSFSVNFLSKKYLKDIEIGSHSGLISNKFKESKLTKIKTDNNCCIKQAQLVYECEFIENYVSKEFNQYNNIIGRIKHVYIDNKLYKNDNLDVLNYHPVFYIGTDLGRFYR